MLDPKDYIENPRSEDGYRSIHLMYKYKNELAPDYTGLRLELQIRTKLQHFWATAVESMGTFLGQALKSRQGDQDWLDFFALVSNAFTFIENTKRIPRFAALDHAQTCSEVKRLESEIRAIEKMRGFSTAVKLIHSAGSSKKGYTYHLVILNSIEKTVQIYPYDRNSLNQATEDYAKFEKDASNGAPIEPVLVSAGPIDSLKKAYPSFFLDIGEFLKVVESIIGVADSQPSPP